MSNTKGGMETAVDNFNYTVGNLVKSMINVFSEIGQDVLNGRFGLPFKVTL